MSDDATLSGAAGAFPPDPTESRLRELYRVSSPSVRVSMIESFDGLATGPDGTSRSLNGEPDLRILRVNRSWADVVLIGAETARAEEYSDVRLRAELSRARAGEFRLPEPDLAIVTASGDVPDDLDPDRTWLVTTSTAPAVELADDWRDRVIVAGVDELDVEALIAAFSRRGLRRVLCEGGPAIASALFDADVVDDYCLTTSPMQGGENARHVPDAPAGLTLTHTLSGAGFEMRRWSRV